MRIVFIFYLSLCSLVLNGTGNAKAGSSQNVEKTHLVTFLNTHTPGAEVKHASGDKVKCFFSVGDEDDDEDLVVVRKYVLLGNLIPAAPVADYFFNYLYRLPFCQHLSHTSSYKYIIQRVLKI